MCLDLFSCMFNQPHLRGISAKVSEDTFAIESDSLDVFMALRPAWCQSTGLWYHFLSTLHCMNLVFSKQHRQPASPETLDIHETQPHHYVRTNEPIHRKRRSEKADAVTRNYFQLMLPCSVPRIMRNMPLERGSTICDRVHSLAPTRPRHTVTFYSTINGHRHREEDDLESYKSRIKPAGILKPSQL